MSDLSPAAISTAPWKQRLSQQLLECMVSIFSVLWQVDFFISSGRDMIQRLEQAQINSVQCVWSLLNYSKALQSGFNFALLLHVFRLFQFICIHTYILYIQNNIVMLILPLITFHVPCILKKTAEVHENIS
jgi:hypothetical protein